MVSEQIQELLHEHDCVIIPDFGGLIAQYAPARIHPVKHTVSPPSKKIAFNEKLKQNDGLLISSLSQHLRISLSDAQQLVGQFVNGLQTDLNQSQKCELKGIGIFRYNHESKIEFEYLAGDNFLENSFGLPELVARPVIPAEAAALRAIRSKTTRPEKAPAKNKLNRFIDKYATVAGSVLLGGLTISLIYLVSLQTDYNLSSLNPAALFQRNAKTEQASDKTVSYSKENPQLDYYSQLPLTPEKESVNAIEQDAVLDSTEENSTFAEADAEVMQPETALAKPATEAEKPEKAAGLKPAEPTKKENSIAKAEKVAALKPAAEVVAKNKKENKPADAIKAKTGRYFIIFGGFASKENALRCQQDLTGKGAQSDIILPPPGNKLHRVSVAEFKTQDEASIHLPELREKYGNALWILNY